MNAAPDSQMSMHVPSTQVSPSAALLTMRTGNGNAVRSCLRPAARSPRRLLSGRFARIVLSVQLISTASDAWAANLSRILSGRGPRSAVSDIPTIMRTISIRGCRIGVAARVGAAGPLECRRQKQICGKSDIGAEGVSCKYGTKRVRIAYREESFTYFTTKGSN